MKKPVLCIPLLLFFLSLATVLPARGIIEGRRNAGQNSVNVIQVTGRVRLVGNEPVTELVISTPEKEWFVGSNDKEKLKDLQHRTVTVQGIETVVSLTFARGISAGERRTLENIKIIKIE